MKMRLFFCPVGLRRIWHRFGSLLLALFITLLLTGYLVSIFPPSELIADVPNHGFKPEEHRNSAKTFFIQDKKVTEKQIVPPYTVSRQHDKKQKKNAVEAIDQSFFNKKAIQAELTERARRVHEVCWKYGLGRVGSPGLKTALVKHPPIPHYSIFYIDVKHGLSFCPLFKAASTSWMYNFCLLGGFSEEYLANTKEQLNKVARRVHPSLEWPEAEEALNKTLKFLIVRHPFERLLSAYRDKLENVRVGLEHGVKHYYKKYGQKIVRKYRKRENQTHAEKLKSVDKIKEKSADEEFKHHVSSLSPLVGIEPTFEEFVKYLIDLDVVHYSDDHWMPYYLHCTPCLLEYDVIAKFETLDRDQNFIIYESHLENKIKPRWSHKTKGVKTSTLAAKYFSQVSQEDVQKLYEKYRLDFELFDYTPDEYLAFAKS